MRLIQLVRHNGRRQMRDRVGLLLTLFTAPLLVLFYGLFLAKAPPAAPKVVVLNPPVQNAAPDHPGGAQTTLPVQIEPVLNRLGRTGTGLIMVSEQQRFRRILLSGEAGLGVEIKTGENRMDGWQIIAWGDASSPDYRLMIAEFRKSLAESALSAFGIDPHIQLVEKPLGISAQRSAFDRYVPGLLVFAVIMLVFSSAMSITREVDYGTLVRLKMTPLGTGEIMLGLSLVQLLLGIASTLITFFTARILGFSSAGSTGTALLLIGLGCLSSVGIGLMVASLARNLFRSFLIASVCMFLMVLFSGLLFPPPEAGYTIGAALSVGPFDLLPTTHLASGLDKVLTLGADPGEVLKEIAALMILSLAYGLIGMAIFRRTCYSFSHG